VFVSASKISPFLVTRAATTCEPLPIRQFHRDDKNSHWTSIVRFDGNVTDIWTTSFGKLVIAPETKDFLKKYQLYIENFKKKCHQKISGYSSSFVFGNTDLYAYVKTRVIEKDYLSKSLAKFQGLVGKCEELISQWSGWLVPASLKRQKHQPRLSRAQIRDLVASLNADAEELMTANDWSLIINKSDMMVWKKYLSSNLPDHEYPLVKANGIINAPPNKVLEMMVDSNRVKEYNKFSYGRDDVEVLSTNTKIVWNRTWPPFCVKPHDFCSIMHHRSIGEAGYIMITKATEHPDVPVRSAYQRSKILMGINILRPVPGDTSRTNITTYNHVISKGVPILIADKVSVHTAADFLTNIEKAFL